MPWNRRWLIDWLNIFQETVVWPCFSFLRVLRASIIQWKWSGENGPVKMVRWKWSGENGPVKMVRWKWSWPSVNQRTYSVEKQKNFVDRDSRCLKRIVPWIGMKWPTGLRVGRLGRLQGLVLGGGRQRRWAGVDGVHHQGLILGVVGVLGPVVRDEELVDEGAD